MAYNNASDDPTTKKNKEAYLKSPTTTAMKAGKRKSSPATFQRFSKHVPLQVTIAGISVVSTSATEYIVANRPENGGTVPNFTPLSRYCPEIYKAKPQKFN